jgi:GH24 family phage-related lysozyme (muramidase)
MAYITAKEDAGLSPNDSPQSADSYVPAGGQLGIDWIKPTGDPNLATICLAGPYTFPGGSEPLAKGSVRFLNPTRFQIPDNAWVFPNAGELKPPSPPTQPLPPSAPVPATLLSPGLAALIPHEVAAINHFFEGCRLDAYKDPRTGGLPITIGWGSTFYKDMSPIQLGDQISQAEADDLYSFNCYHRFWKVLEAKIPSWREMTTKQQAALCSFAYNIGPSFYGDKDCTTITNNLRERNWTEVPGTIMMYRNPGEDVEVGLGRRRRAEGLMWIGIEPAAACRQAVQEIQTPEDCERYEQELKKNPPKLAGVRKAAPVGSQPAQPASASAAGARPNPLGIWMPAPGVTDFTIPVKHYTQCDNRGGRGDRECFKTSCTMLADYVTNGKLSSMQKEQGLAEPEDAYQSFMDGDTTIDTVHIRALKKLGIEAYSSRAASIRDVEDSLDCGIPVPIGVKYKSHLPGGGGHWVLVNGRGPKGWDVLCPNGIRNGATDAWIQIFQTEADAKADSFSTGLLKQIFADLGPENGYAIFVTAVNGVPTGVRSSM